MTCAVSGGADSTALMVLAAAAGLSVTAVHVDHGLRPGSDEEGALVAANAQAFGLDVRCVRVDVAAGPNLEARARAARYTALPHDVLTGHTADDQAETVLINVLRGAGASGLAAMRPGPRRPLLGVRRHETTSLCAALSLPVVVDPSNDDPAHLRNRVRHELLPMMADLSGRDPVPVLARLADVARVDSDVLDELAGALDPTDARALAGASPALARRAVRRWLTDDYPPDLATVERVLAVARGEVRAAETNDGRRVHRSGQRMHLSGPSRPPNDGVS